MSPQHPIVVVGGSWGVQKAIWDNVHQPSWHPNNVWCLSTSTPASESIGGVFLERVSAAPSAYGNVCTIGWQRSARDVSLLGAPNTYGVGEGVVASAMDEHVPVVLMFLCLYSLVARTIQPAQTCTLSGGGSEALCRVSRWSLSAWRS